MQNQHNNLPCDDGMIHAITLVDSLNWRALEQFICSGWPINYTSKQRCRTELGMTLVARAVDQCPRHKHQSIADIANFVRKLVDWGADVHKRTERWPSAAQLFHGECKSGGIQGDPTHISRRYSELYDAMRSWFPLPRDPLPVVTDFVVADTTSPLWNEISSLSADFEVASITQTADSDDVSLVSSEFSSLSMSSPTNLGGVHSCYLLRNSNSNSAFDVSALQSGLTAISLAEAMPRE